MPEQVNYPSASGLYRDIRSEVQQGEATDLYFRSVENGEPQTMSTVTVSVYRPSGSEMPTPIAAESVTQDPGTMLCKVSLTSVNTAVRDEGYYAVWRWSDQQGVAFKRRQAFDIVRQRLYPVITEDDLKAYVPNLDRLLPSVAGTKLQTSWQPQLDAAFRALQERLLANGNRPHLILDPERLRLAHTLKALVLIADVLDTHSAGDTWAAKRETWSADYEAHWKALRFEYDYTDDGTISGLEGHQRAHRRKRLIRGTTQPVGYPL